ncbi:MAG: hypothetical protein KAH95_02940 [Spirochaetales bacterium]|nr:hypothetical protein [Spirochaetales bacterium]
MKIISISIIIFTLTFGVLFAVDFGGSIDGTSIISYSEDLSDYRESNLSLWLSSDFGNDIKFFSKGSYTYSTVSPYLFEIDFLNINKENESIFSYTVGRLWTSDFSGYIFNHTMDGVKAEFNYPTASISISAGYTGFLFKESSSVLISKADKSDLLNSEKIFAAPRIISGIDLLLPELFLFQDLNISFWMQYDMHSEADLLDEGPQLPSTAQGGKLHTQYTGIGLKGTLAPSLYYDSQLYLGTGQTLSYIDSTYTYENILSFLGTFGIRYYSQDRYFSKTGFTFIYSSGDSDYSNFTEGNTESTGANFIPISRATFGQVFSPLLGNIFLAQLNYSRKPFGSSDNTKLKNIQTELTANGFFRSSTGNISEPGIDPSSDSLYLGTEIDIKINFRLFSDLGMSFSGGVFFPDTSSSGAFLASGRNIELSGKVEFSLSF